MSLIIKDTMIPNYLETKMKPKDGVTTNVIINAVTHVQIVTYSSQEGFENGAIVGFFKKSFIDFVISCGGPSVIKYADVTAKYDTQIPESLYNSLIIELNNGFDNYLIMPEGMSLAIAADMSISDLVIQEYISSGVDEELDMESNNPVSNKALAYKFSHTTEGLNTEYNINSLGWKRIAILCRAHGLIGSITVGRTTASGGRSMQCVTIGASTSVQYLSKKLTGSVTNGLVRMQDLRVKPILYQISNNTFGENPFTTDRTRICRIDKVRLSYPKNWDTVDTISGSDLEKEYKNPINVYLDIHLVDGNGNDVGECKPIDFDFAMFGDSESHRVEPIIEETNCDDPVTGFNGVLCDTYELSLKENYGLYMPDYSRFDNLSVDSLYRVDRIKEYHFNYDNLINGQIGHNKLNGLSCTFDKATEDAIDTSTCYLLPKYENHLVDICPIEKTTKGISITRYPNGIIRLNGTSTATDLLPLFHIESTDATLRLPCPIVLYPGKYLCRDCKIELVPLTHYRTFEGTNRYDYKDTNVTEVFGYKKANSSNTLTQEFTISVPSVIVRCYINISAKGTVYNNKIYYPQVCRADTGVVELINSSTNPIDIKTRDIPYTPKPYAIGTVKDVSAGSSTAWEKADIRYAQALEVYAKGYDISGTADIEVITPFVNDDIESDNCTWSSNKIKSLVKDDDKFLHVTFNPNPDYATTGWYDSHIDDITITEAVEQGKLIISTINCADGSIKQVYGCEISADKMEVKIGFLTSIWSTGTWNSGT